MIIDDANIWLQKIVTDDNKELHKMISDEDYIWFQIIITVDVYILLVIFADEDYNIQLYNITDGD